ncbi:hypothetical protein LUZ61_016756 [Rhynchospora tenuis]|uniref:Cytochrome P450 n=1 Tax=Rhynchospora tenuis TaxID=198213 RepID=A0AAD5Z641_9POAL|nr:hypothetical protein LUZ61_016756 [Rhynchospora tenuis]
MSPLFPTIAILLLPFLSLLLRFLYNQLYLPYLASLRFSRQGITGPTRRLISGNAPDYRAVISKAQSTPLPCIHHDVVDRVAPFFSQWIAQFGYPFVYWFGSMPRLVITDPDLVKTVLLDTTGLFRKRQSANNPLARQLIGEGLPGLDGSKWAHHRRIIAPAFNMERVKAWIPEIATTSSSMLDKWELQGGKRTEFEIDVHREFLSFSADVISRVAFGSSYEEGKRVFELQDEQAHLVSVAMRSIYIPGFRFIPTKKNQMRSKINKEIRDSLRKLILTNRSKCEDSKNLLGLMLAASKTDGQEMGIEEIIDECKTFYFAGKETTANLLTWVVLLLGMHQEWQQKAREEVMAVCGKDHYPSADDLANLRTISMILKETLRLYPPAVFLNRIARKDIKLGKYDIPKGTQVQLPVIYLHHDTKIWGPDAHEFKPQRFAEGTSHHLGAYLPFGAGPAICVGQNLANVETKVALVMILQRFEFQISPSYMHAPMLFITLQPQYGVQVLFHKI